MLLHVSLTYLFTYLCTYLFSYLLTYLLTYLLLTYLLTYSMDRVLLEKLTSFQLVNRFPAFYGTRRFRIHRYQPPVPILSHVDLVHTPTAHFLMIHLNIILPSTLGSPKWSLILLAFHPAIIDYKLYPCK